MVLFNFHEHWGSSQTPSGLESVAKRHEIAAFQNHMGYLSAKEIEEHLAMEAPGKWVLFHERSNLRRMAMVSPKAVEELSFDAFKNSGDDSEGYDMSICLASMTDNYYSANGLNHRNVSALEYEKTSRDLLESLLQGRYRAENFEKGFLRFGFSKQRRYLERQHIFEKIAKEYSSHFDGMDILAREKNGEEFKTLRPYVESVRPYLEDLKIHCGELKGPESIHAALEYFPTDLVHGASIIEDPSLMEKISREGTFVTFCPPAYNYTIKPCIEERGCLGLYYKYPLITMLDVGIRCVLGIDNRTTFRASTKDIYQAAENEGADMGKIGLYSRMRIAQLKRQRSG